MPKTISVSKQARIGRDLAGDFVILISGFFMHDFNVDSPENAAREA